MNWSPSQFTLNKRQGLFYKQPLTLTFTSGHFWVSRVYKELSGMQLISNAQFSSLVTCKLYKYAEVFLLCDNITLPIGMVALLVQCAELPVAIGENKIILVHGKDIE